MNLKNDEIKPTEQEIEVLADIMRKQLEETRMVKCYDWAEEILKAGYTRSPTSTEKRLGPCTCDQSHAKTVRRVMEGIWQCPRCGGVGTVKRSTEPTMQPLNEEAIKACLEEGWKCAIVAIPKYMQDELTGWFARFLYEAKFHAPVRVPENHMLVKREDLIKLFELSGKLGSNMQSYGKAVVEFEKHLLSLVDDLSKQGETLAQ